MSCETIVISAAGLGFGRLLGMVAEAEKKGLFHRKKVRTILATSAGCFIALTLALNLSFTDVIQHLTEKMSKRKFHQGSFLSTIVKGIANGYMLDTELREDLIDSLLALAGKEKDISFEEVYSIANVRLSFNTIEIDSGKTHHLGYFTTPNISVRDSILASTSIPTLFPPQEIRISGQVYRFIDGGLHSYLNLDALDSCSICPIQYDPFYSGRSIPVDYDLGFLTYTILDNQKVRNDVFSIMQRMLHIMQLGVVERLRTAPKILSSTNTSSLSYFQEFDQEQITEEIEEGRKEIRKIFEKPENLPISLRCREIQKE